MANKNKTKKPKRRKRITITAEYLLQRSIADANRERNLQAGHPIEEIEAAAIQELRRLEALLKSGLTKGCMWSIEEP